MRIKPVWNVILIDTTEKTERVALECDTEWKARKMLTRLNKIIGKDCYHTIKKVWKMY